MVAPILFEALLTIPHLSQISYIGFDGVFLSYYSKENQHFVLYSNDSLSSSSTSIWYTQSINEESGTPYGEAVVTSPSNVANSSWFQEALSSMNKSSSIGYGWSNNEVLLFSNTLCLNRKGLVSLGFPIRDLADYFSSVMHHNGSLYLDVEHGTQIIQGIPNTLLKFSNNLISFILLNGEEEEIARVGDVMCQSNGDKLNLWGIKYVITCSQLQIFGVELEYVLVLPNEPSDLQEEFGCFCASVQIVFHSIIMFFVIPILSAAKQVICLRAALIKQMEATQQAERKDQEA
ncbi:hypothetical protein Leryth_011682 [Lithospermum erythrorhizon]|nr:hypothetical protein Leryth_011682 [Lithospermum erythrorhizon]